MLLASIFLLSFAYKIVSHEDFAIYVEYTFNIDKTLAVYLSNIMLGIELYIALQLLFSHNRVFYIYASVMLLAVFALFNIYLIVKDSNSNCYCFGTVMPMNAVTSLIKNIIIIVVSLSFVWKEKVVICFKYYGADIFKIIFTLAIMLVLFDNPKNMIKVEVEAIDVSAIKKDVNKYMIIDSRAPGLYAGGHIENAISYPFYNQKYTDIQIPELDATDKIIVTYCDSKICSLAKNLAIAIKKKYHSKTVYYLKGGIESWQKGYS